MFGYISGRWHARGARVCDACCSADDEAVRAGRRGGALRAGAGQPADGGVGPGLRAEGRVELGRRGAAAARVRVEQDARHLALGVRGAGGELLARALRHAHPPAGRVFGAVEAQQHRDARREARVRARALAARDGGGLAAALRGRGVDPRGGHRVRGGAAGLADGGVRGGGAVVPRDRGERGAAAREGERARVPGHPEAGRVRLSGGLGMPGGREVAQGEHRCIFAKRVARDVLKHV